MDDTGGTLKRDCTKQLGSLLEHNVVKFSNLEVSDDASMFHEGILDGELEGALLEGARTGLGLHLEDLLKSSELVIGGTLLNVVLEGSHKEFVELCDGGELGSNGNLYGEKRGRVTVSETFGRERAEDADIS